MLPIERLNHKFEGEFHFRRHRYSVPFLLPGDQVQFQLIRQGGRLRIKVHAVEKAALPPPGLMTAVPFCSAFARCGGCRAQHIEYDEQIRIKAEPIVSAMRTKFAVDPEIIAAPLTSGFRNRMDFVIEGKECVGLRGAGDYKLFVDLEQCPVQRPKGNEILALFRTALAAHPGAAFRRSTREGCVKFATVRAGEISGALVLTVEKELDEPKKEVLARMLADLTLALEDYTLKCGYDVSLVICETVHPADVSCIPGGRVILGSGSFRDKLGGLAFEIPYDGFFQPNPSAFDSLLRWSRSAAEASAASTLYDLYCGSGVISRIFSSFFPGRFSQIIGFESVASAASAAQAGSAGFAGHSVFHAVDLNRDGALALDAENAFVVCDPPRAGLSGEVKRALCEARDRISHVLYISCNPESQLRDMSDVSDAYRPVCAAIVDCFPQTHHLEQAVLLAATHGTSK